MLNNIIKKINDKMSLRKIVTILAQGRLYYIIVAQYLLIDICTRAILTSSNTYPVYYLNANIATIIYAAFICCVIACLKGKSKRIVYLASTIIFALIAIVQIVYYAGKSDVFSFCSMAFAGEGQSYIFSTILKAVQQYWFFIIVLIVYCAIAVYVYKNIKIELKFSFKPLLAGCITLVVSLLIINITVFANNADDGMNNYFPSQTESTSKNYINFSSPTKIFSMCGMVHYTCLDIANCIFPNKHKMSDEDYNFLKEQTSKTANEANEYTGIFEGKNVIFLQLESIDTIYLNDTLMPFLSMLQANSINFQQHYSYNYGPSSTINSEFAVNNSVNMNMNNNVYTLSGHEYPYSMPRILEKFGNYKSNIFHFNHASFYNRDNLYAAWGYQNYYGLLDTGRYNNNRSYAELDSTLIQDQDFYDKIFKCQQPFANSIITYTEHPPFNGGNPRLNKLVENRYNVTEKTYEFSDLSTSLEYAKETDSFIAQLMEGLKANGLYDNTVLVVYTDHYQYSLAGEPIVKYKCGDNDNLINNTPFFIWSSDLKNKFGAPDNLQVQKADEMGFTNKITPGIGIRCIDTVNMQIDILPTVLNMLGVSYDAAKFVGHDIFDNNRHYMYHSANSIFDGQFYISDGKVKYVDTSTWENEIANYDESQNAYITKSGKRIDKSYVDSLYSEVADKVRKNNLILNYGYLN